MSRFRLRRPGGAMLIAVAALFVALGGTSYAAFSLPKNSVAAGSSRTTPSRPARSRMAR
jgi:hypothetical protein